MVPKTQHMSNGTLAVPFPRSGARLVGRPIFGGAVSRVAISGLSRDTDVVSGVPPMAVSFLFTHHNLHCETSSLISPSA